MSEEKPVIDLKIYTDGTIEYAGEVPADLDLDEVLGRFKELFGRIAGSDMVQGAIGTGALDGIIGNLLGPFLKSFTGLDVDAISNIVKMLTGGDD